MEQADVALHGTGSPTRMTTIRFTHSKPVLGPYRGAMRAREEVS
jgi:glutamate dehydrogenase/leucine dehydrogenase